MVPAESQNKFILTDNQIKTKSLSVYPYKSQ